MGEDTKIAWTRTPLPDGTRANGFTFNPWWGCTHDGPECDHCYAETWAKRTGHAVWGAEAPRRFFGDMHWGEPLLWDRKAQKLGVRLKVFCASMADIGERLSTAEGARMDEARRRLVALICRTPNLNWLLLTKRPQNLPTVFPEFGAENWPDNVWLGTTAGNEEGLRKRAKYLVKLKSPVLFISYEPALGPADFRPSIRDGISWILCGGESGSKARPFELEWARQTIAQCREVGAAPFIKQLGSKPVDVAYDMPSPYLAPFKLKHSKGEDPSEWPMALRVQDFP